ncbi:hypothetical protein DFJ73DRAFT_164984 [Zopfochytrium polystomum]|nr:hypothetical protein DFJ73DRAFT_164984 [Zopfochytrium polystomum]
MADPLFSESSALREACALGHTSIVALLASHGADVTACNHEALKAAAARGHSGCVQVCIRHGSDVHVENDCALRDACANGHSDTVKVLLEAGASASVALGVSSAVLEVIIRSSTLFGSVASPADCFGCGSTHVDELERVESFSLPLAEDHMGTCDHLEDAADGSRTQILLAVPGAIWELLGWTRSLWLGIADNGEEDLPWAVMRATAC